MSGRERSAAPAEAIRSRNRAADIARWVKRDYAAVAGKVVMLKAVSGYDHADNNVDRPLDPPVAFKVSTEVPEGELTRAVDNWIDPIWDVEPCDPRDPQIADLHSFCCYGQSYHLFEPKEEPGDLSDAPVPALKKFRVPFSYRLHGVLIVEAPTPAEASAKADQATMEEIQENGHCSGMDLGVPEEIKE